MKKCTPQEAKEKIYRYCAYQERSHQEVRRKLYDYGLFSTDVENFLTELITAGFLNEERYARAFAGGKFRMKKWGRIKIVHALEAQGLTANCIEAGLSEINSEDYEETLRDILIKKIEGSTDKNIFVQRDKISKSAILKGYEPDFVWRLLRTLLPDPK